jgi:hypothetical protein
MRSAASCARLGPWKTNVKLVEPPSHSAASAIIFIGQNSRGHWVVQHQDGLYGGLFVNRSEALRYALFENHHHPEAIVELRHEIELDMVTAG